MADEDSPTIENVEEGRRSLASDRRSLNQEVARENVNRRCPRFSKCQIATSCITLFLLVGFGLCIYNMLHDPESYDRVSYGYLACLCFVGLMLILYCAYPTSRLQFAALFVACVLLVVSGIYIGFAVGSAEKEKIMTDVLVSVFCFIGFAGLLCYSICSRFGYSPLSLWDNLLRRVAAARNDNLERVESSDDPTSSARQGVDSRCSTNTAGRDSDPEASREGTGASDLPRSDSCSYATPSEEDVLLQTSSTDEASTVKTISEVAAKISRIASESVPEKAERAEASQASSSANDGEKAPSQSSQECVSESEGEMRRRKLPNPDELPVASSDEEPKVYLQL